ncbi:MAG: 2-oxoacid:acceptor oxidoreductase subunit alpha [Phycisphaerae bacterium]|nr:2-oxoacid:acceptor oxidoreductase subunit alpha [Phycisphaerae bacterium]
MSQTNAPTEAAGSSGAAVEILPRVVVRFAGDSGDGMQLAGTQFTNTSAVFGNDVSTLPDFPAEIRAPAGTRPGVSGFQISFSSEQIRTPGDELDALIAMNPAALLTNIDDLREGGLLIVNSDEFTPQNFAKAKVAADPLDSPRYERYRVHKVPITLQTREAVKESGLGAKDAERCKNFYALGLVYWLYDRPLDTTLGWINEKFGKKPQVAQANTLALKAGFNFGDTAEIFPLRYRVARAKLPKGKYRNIIGNQALAIGLVTAARLAKKPLFYGTYPITPASDILHELAHYKNFDIRTFQAEDEIAAICSAIGASYAGAIGVTGSSGPGIALKQEAVGLAVMTELPLLILNVQRAGPSTGMPTKTEQADLWQAVLGRNGECPVAVIAAQSPADCFDTAIEATRIALQYMTPVFVLSDGYVANSSEPWPIVKASDLKPIEVKHAAAIGDGTNGANGADGAAPFLPYARDARGVRPWAIPGTPGLRHRIGGLEKADLTGEISYDAANHQRMTDLRAAKIANIAREIPPQEVYGDADGELLAVSWGGTFGAVRTAIDEVRAAGRRAGHLHLRWLNPLPNDTEAILRRFKRVIVCELNMGQLQQLIRGKFAIDAAGYHKVQGKPFTVAELVRAFR